MKIYIEKSKLHGKGIFARRDIKKGETVFVMKGNKIKFLINNKLHIIVIYFFTNEEKNKKVYN